MADVYRIKDWKLFESAQSRRCKELKWIAVTNKHDGSSFRRLMAHKDGLTIFGAWILILQVASRCVPRVTLLNDDKPLTAEDLHFKTGAPEKDFAKAFEVLSSPPIEWLEIVDSECTRSAINKDCSDSESARSVNINPQHTPTNQTKPDTTGQDKHNITKPDSKSGAGFKDFFEKFGIDLELVGKMSLNLGRLIGATKPDPFIDKVAIMSQMQYAEEGTAKAMVIEAAKAVQDSKPRPMIPLAFFRKCLQNRIPDFETKLAEIP